MTRSVFGRCAVIGLGLVMLGGGRARAQTLTIGIIDFYGLHDVSPDRVRAALTFTEGDPVSFASNGQPDFTASKAKIAALRGVERVRVELVCCDKGRAIVYVGIEERGIATMTFRLPPTGDARLAADVVQAGTDLERALSAAIERGEAAEDDSQGHALAHDPAAGAIQERFVGYANRDLPQIRRVLRESSDPEQRALAAEVIAYAGDKSAVVNDLVYAVSDPSPSVRNNAVRALAVMASMKPGTHVVPQVPADPFIDLLRSPVWTDRNKGSMALFQLTASRDPRLLEALRPAIPQLAEMARWKNEGHAVAPFLILARMAGYSDNDAIASFRRGDRDVVITAASNLAARP